MPENFFQRKKFYLKGELQTQVKDQFIGYKSVTLNFGSDVSYFLKLKNNFIESNKEYGLFFNNQKEMNYSGGLKRDFINQKNKLFLKWKIYFCNFLFLNYNSLEKINKYKFLLNYYFFFDSKVFIYSMFYNNFFSRLPLKKQVKSYLNKYIYYSSFHLEYLNLFLRNITSLNFVFKKSNTLRYFLCLNSFNYINQKNKINRNICLRKIFFYRVLLYKKHGLWKYKRLDRISKKKRSYSCYVKNSLYVQKSNAVGLRQEIKDYYYKTSLFIMTNKK